MPTIDVEQFAQILGVSAIITTIITFFMGVPICVDIYRRKSTKEISSFPFVISLVSLTFWFRYGLLKGDVAMIVTNGVGLALFLCYNIFYLVHTKDKRLLVMQYLVVVFLNYAMLIYVARYAEDKSTEMMLGTFSAIVQIVTFGAPLVGVYHVFKKRSCDTLPLPLIAGYALVSLQWCIYGWAMSDVPMMVANVAGFLLGLFQLTLFLVFPMHAGCRAPLSRCFKCLRSPEGDDDESGQVAEDALVSTTVIDSSSFASSIGYNYYAV